MATVDNLVSKPVDLTLSSSSEHTRSDQGVVAISDGSRSKESSFALKPRSQAVSVDLTNDSKKRQSDHTTPPPFSTSITASISRQRQLTSHEVLVKALRANPLDMNNRQLDNSFILSSLPQKLDEPSKESPTPSSKRKPGLAKGSKKSHSSSKQLELPLEKGQRESPLQHGSRGSSKADISKKGSLTAPNGERLGVGNNWQFVKGSSRSTLPSSSTPQPHGKVARKSAVQDHVLAGRNFAEPALLRSSSLNKSSILRSNESPSYGSPHHKSQAGESDNNVSTEDSNVKFDKRSYPGSPNGGGGDNGRSSLTVNGAANQGQAESADTPMLDVCGPKEMGHAMGAFSPNVGSNLAEQKMEAFRVSPLSLPDFEQRLKHYLARLRSDHQYHVKSRLSQARKVSEGQILQRNSFSTTLFQATPAISQKKRDSAKFMQKVSPFSELKSIEHDPPQSKGRVGKLGQYVSKTPTASKPVVSYPYVVYRQKVAAIPPYTTYIPTKRNVLIEDDKHRTYLPYLGEQEDVQPEDNDYAALETKIEDNQRNYHKINRIMERASLHASFIEDFLRDVGSSSEAVLEFLLDESGRAPPSDLLPEMRMHWKNRIEYLQDEGYYEDQDDSDVTLRPKTSHVKRPQKQWRLLFESLPKRSTGNELAAACLACHIFRTVASFSLFHVVKQYQVERDSNSPRRSKPEDYSIPELHSLGTYAELVCQICKAHECPGHGEYDDSDDEKNMRIRVNLKPALTTSPNGKLSSSKPNKAALDRDTTVKQLMGLEEDGKTVSGPFWAALREGADSGFGDQELCSDDCFWPKHNRADRLSVWSDEDRKSLKMLRPAFENDRRGACMIAQTRLISKPCKEIFLMLFETIPVSTRYSMRAYNEARALADKVKMPPRKNHDHWLENPTTSHTWMQHEREPFLPCNHLGPCDEGSNCDCFENGITCEKSCACSETCPRRFQGCRCAQKGKSCRFNDRCDCWRLNRECDPDLCRSCGAYEVLDPTNRRKEGVVQGKCTNVYIQRGVPKRTLLGPSKLMAAGKKSGWGLYMGEECKKGDYIGEYRGEIISDLEADLRGTIYDKRNVSYLFTLNNGQTLDSTLMGNKLRFINHQADPFANCQAKLLLCNSVQRIGMFALKDIEIGEEMYFNYGPGFATKFDLIKMNHDGPPTIESPQKNASTNGKSSSHGKRWIAGSASTSGTLHMNPHRHMKNTLSKNGVRIGRPPKYPVFEDHAASTAMLNSEDSISLPQGTGSSKRGKRNAKKRRRSEAVLDEDPEDDEYVHPAYTVKHRNESPRGYAESDEEEQTSPGDESAISENLEQDMKDLTRILASKSLRRGQKSARISDSEEVEVDAEDGEDDDDDDGDESIHSFSSHAEGSLDGMRLERVRVHQNEEQQQLPDWFQGKVRDSKGKFQAARKAARKSKAAGLGTASSAARSKSNHKIKIGNNNHRTLSPPALLIRTAAADPNSVTTSSSPATPIPRGKATTDDSISIDTPQAEQNGVIQKLAVNLGPRMDNNGSVPSSASKVPTTPTRMVKLRIGNRNGNNKHQAGAGLMAGGDRHDGSEKSRALDSPCGNEATKGREGEVGNHEEEKGDEQKEREGYDGVFETPQKRGWRTRHANMEEQQKRRRKKR